MTDTAPRVVVPPAKKAGNGAPSGGRPAGTTNRASAGMVKIETGLNDLVQSVALGLSVTGNDIDAVIVASRGPRVAAAWTELARQNPRVREFLLRAMEGSAWAGIAVATLGMALPIMQHHGVIPATMPHPFMLTDDERQRIDAVRAARAAAFTPPPA